MCHFGPHKLRYTAIFLCSATIIFLAAITMQLVRKFDKPHFVGAPPSKQFRRQM